jgi:hypothetical protein
MNENTVEAAHVEPLAPGVKAEARSRILASGCGPRMRQALSALLDGDTSRAAAAAAGLASHQDVFRTAKALGIATTAKRASLARVEAEGRLAPRYRHHVEALKRSA